MRARHFIGGGLFLALALTGCGGGGAATTPDTGTSGSSDGGIQVSADPSGQLKFQPAALTAKADEAIGVSFKNPGPLPHNWVLVAPGEEQAVVAASAAKGGDATGVAGVIVTTSVLTANGSEAKELPAKPAGTYSYICTVPGHYAAGMKGTLTLK